MQPSDQSTAPQGDDDGRDPDYFVERPRTLGLDVGTVRIGVALSCPFGRMASPLCVLPRAKDPFGRIVALCQLHGVARVVVGRPLRLSGERGPAVLQVEQFVRRLAEDLVLPTYWVDERLTTAAAERTMLQLGARRATRRQHIDQVAAALLLQTFLDGAKSAQLAHASAAAEDAGSAG